ncbi:MAG: RHS repeat-associated core domain-containing protein, partial [Terriglobia bacterium]
MTGDGTHSYMWDAEGRLTAVDGGSTASMAYNALGRMAQRILPSNPSGWQNVEYQYDASGQAIGGSIPAYPQVSARLPLPSGAIAYYMYSWNTTIFAHVNASGSLTQTTSSTGGVAHRLTYYPWGQIWADAGTDYWEDNFAGQEMTMPESGLNYTPNRMYNPTPGRWLTPDALGGSITNPQSLNRYAYALNNPTTLTDPTGLQSGNGSCYQYYCGPTDCPAQFDSCYSTSG